MSRIWSAIRAFTTRWMPAAVATTSSPRRPATVATAVSAARASSRSDPPAKFSGLR